jgi:rRNA-processing protein FCF1
MPDSAKKKPDEGVHVILDTNFLIDLFRFKLRFEDIEDAIGAGCDLFVVRRTVGELTGLPNKEAKVALAFVKSGRIGIIEPPRTKGTPSKSGRRKASADDAILEFFAMLSGNDGRVRKDRDGEYMVATNDQKLRKRLKPYVIRTLFLRARKQIMMH